MTGTKKDDGCGHDAGSAIADELAPMRKWEGGMSSGGYTSGPTHLDRTDFGDDEPTPTEADADAPATEAEAEAPEPDASPDDVG